MSISVRTKDISLLHASGIERSSADMKGVAILPTEARCLNNVHSITPTMRKRRGEIHCSDDRLNKRVGRKTSADSTGFPSLSFLHMGINLLRTMRIPFCHQALRTDPLRKTSASFALYPPSQGGWRRAPGGCRLALTILCLLISFPVLHAQDTTDTDPRHSSLLLLSRSYGDSVVLRWGPQKPGGWIIANSIGYIVERRQVRGENDDPRQFERLTPVPLRPWTVDQWKARSTPDQKYAAIAMQMLYGKSAVPQDGGELRSLRLAADELVNRHGFALFAADMSPHAADGLALRLVDRNVHPGETWVYRVFIARQDSTYRIDTAYTVVDIAPSTPVPSPVDLTVDERDGSILLQWKNFEGMAFTAFNVERSDDGGASFRRINANPIVPMTSQDALREQPPSYLDSTIRNYQRYQYRVRGITPFGEESDAAVITAMGRDRTPPPAPLMDKPLLPAGNAVNLRWKIEGNTSDLAGFVVAKSPYPDQGFRQITPDPIPASARSFLDTAGSESEPYYIVGAVDTAGNVAASLPIVADLIDTLPPAMPTGLSGTIDTNGIVVLRWNLGSERDLLGYRVLWANDSTHEFSLKTGEVWSDTVFVDTVKVQTLTRSIYYRIAAIDTRYLPSAMTPILELKRPDVVPPESSVFTDVFVTDSSVVLRWEPSRSSDVARQILFRRRAGDTRWNELATLRVSERLYTDRAVEKRTRYEYRLIAVDSTGLESQPAFDVQGRPYDTGKRPGVRNVRAEYDTKQKSVVLRWTYDTLPEKYWFVVYRSYGDAAPVQYRAVKSDQREFVDALLVGDGQYHYAVRVMSSTGESELSDQVEVVVR